MEKIRKYSNRNISNLLLIYEYLLNYTFVEAEAIKVLFGVNKHTVNKMLENLIDIKILEFVEEKRYRRHVYIKYVDILFEGTTKRKM